MTTQVHPQAQQGFSASTSEHYNKTRPSYPPEVFSCIFGALHSKESINVVEIGSGTGIFTRAMLGHHAWSTSVVALKAVGPSEGMRDSFSRNVEDSRVSIGDGSFTNTGVDSGWADVIVIAQAFHWCMDLQAAVEEFVRISKPQGIVSFVWNTEDKDNVPWIRQLYEYTEKFRGYAWVHARELRWRAAFEIPAYRENFNEPIEETIRWQQPGTVDIVSDRCMSWSPLAILPSDQKAKARCDLVEIVKRGDGMKWVDESKGLFEFGYETLVVIMSRKPEL